MNRSTLRLPMSEPWQLDKAAVLAKVLCDQSVLCAACIASNSALALSDIEPTERRFEQAFVLNRDVAHCKGCKRSTLVYSLYGIRPAKGGA
jgi:hypothetical protein